MNPPKYAALALATVVLGGCKKPPPPAPIAVASVTAAATASAPMLAGKKPARFTGSALARSASGAALYVADEDAKVLRRVALPLVASDAGAELTVDGPPAQVIARDHEVYVTVRDPGRVLVLTEDPDAPAGLKQTATITVAPDAWGLGLSPDEKTLIVTSPWTHTVSVVDIATRAVVVTLDVPREPRGVVFSPDGKKAWVTHLVGTAITRIDVAGGNSTAHSVALPAGAERAPRRSEPSASLAYAPVITDDGARLLVPRHALGTMSSKPGSDGWGGGTFAWWGTSTVDVLWLRDETPLMPPRASVALVGRFGGANGMPDVPTDADTGAVPTSSPAIFVQPRDAVLRHSAGTLLVVSEGFDSVTEHDPRALDPGLTALVRYQLGSGYLTGKSKTPPAETGSAPQAIALSEDENEAYVWCRGSREIMGFSLADAPLAPSKSLYGVDDRTPKAVTAGPFPEPFAKDVAAGRKLFYLGRSDVMSEGLACAGCHPDGRDDGFTWHETDSKPPVGNGANGPVGRTPGVVFVGHPAALFDPIDRGRPRRTPMLAGRVASKGPYGWHAQNKDLSARLIEGFGLHRWGTGGVPTEYEKANRLPQLAAFLRNGLRPPPKDAAPLTADEEKGRAIFESDRAQCKTCHPSDAEFTTRAAMPFKAPLPTRDGFAAEDDQKFKIPSLFFLAGRAPYFHDGSAKDLTDLVEKNGHRMGDTSNLSSDDKAALVAYLKRL